MHGSGWVKLRGVFDPTHHGGLKKIQLNPTYYISPTQPTRVGMNPWLDNFFITIIIKLSRKNININILKKPQRLVSM